MIEVIQAGPQSLVQDLGRPGWAHVGVSRSGALDRAALRLANRLVGNRETAAGIEAAVGGLVLRFGADAWVAVTGAWGPVHLEGRTPRTVEADRAIAVEAGDVLRFGIAEHGLRYYLGIRGGLAVEPVLGSRSTDTLSGLGPAPLAGGDVLAMGTETAGAPPALDALTFWPPADEEIDIAVLPGPRADWFAPAALAAFYDEPWTVSPDADRVGARLVGARLERGRDDELPSEAMVAGSVQVPPSGAPTVLLADHPVTGGYPVIAVVADASLDAFGQLRPGQRLRFHHAR